MTLFLTYLHASCFSVDVTSGVGDKVAGDGTGVCPMAEKQEVTGDTPTAEKKKKSRIRIGMGQKCSFLECIKVMKEITVNTE